MTNIFHDFSTNSEENTAVNGFVVSTGQTITLDAQGNTGATIVGGKVVPVGNSYLTLPFPERSAVLSMEMSWPSGATQGGGKVVAMALGRRGALGITTTQMVHVACDVRGDASPDLSLWDASVTGWQYGFNVPTTPFIDANCCVAAIGTKTRFDVIIAGCQAVAMCDGQRVCKSYYHPAISSLVGDSTPGDGKGYVFFQSGWTAQPGLPYIHSISARSLTPMELACFARRAA